MLFLKMIGSASLMTVAIFACAMSSAYERKVVLTLDGFWELINFAKNKIDLSLLPSEEILRCAEKEKFTLELDGVSSFDEVVKKNGLYLETDAKEELLSFAMGFGEARREEQIKRCERYADAIDEIRGRARGKMAEKIKMKRTLIWSVALCIILVLW